MNSKCYFSLLHVYALECKFVTIEKKILNWKIENTLLIETILANLKAGLNELNERNRDEMNFNNNNTVFKIIM